MVEVSNNLRKTYGVIKSQETVNNPQPVSPAELVQPQSQPQPQPQTQFSQPIPQGVQQVDLNQTSIGISNTIQPNQPTVQQSQLFSQQQMQQPIQGMMPNTGVVPPIQPTGSVQQPQAVVSQQPVAPIAEDNLRYSQPDPQSVAEQIPAYSTDGIPSNCPKKFNVLGNECIMCLKSVSCPFK